jgi:hypothetical protein
VENHLLVEQLLPDITISEWCKCSEVFFTPTTTHEGKKYSTVLIFGRHIFLLSQTRDALILLEDHLTGTTSI